jgi:hypothetical protein
MFTSTNKFSWLHFPFSIDLLLCLVPLSGWKLTVERKSHRSIATCRSLTRRSSEQANIESSMPFLRLVAYTRNVSPNQSKFGTRGRGSYRTTRSKCQRNTACLLSNSHDYRKGPQCLVASWLAGFDAIWATMPLILAKTSENRLKNTYPYKRLIGAISREGEIRIIKRNRKYKL